MDMLDFKVMRGANGAMSFYLNDYRIAGEKPLGGGIVTVLTTVRAKDVLEALKLSDLVGDRMDKTDPIESAVRKMAHSLPPSHLGSTRAIHAISAHVRSAIEAEREAIKAIVADHAAWGRSFGVEDICDKIIAAINARAREG